MGGFPKSPVSTIRFPPANISSMADPRIWPEFSNLTLKSPTLISWWYSSASQSRNAAAMSSSPYKIPPPDFRVSFSITPKLSSNISRASSLVGGEEKIFPRKPSRTSLGMRPVWSMWACVTKRAEISAGLKGKGSPERKSQKRGHWNIPQSAKIFVRPSSKRKQEPVTSCAPP